MSRIHTHYDNLKVARNAPIEVIRAAYKSLSHKHHPDRNLDNQTESTRIMSLINTSYEVLSDTEKRRQHDIWIKEQESEQVTSASKSEQPRRQSENEHSIEFPPPVSGTCLYSDLPKNVQELMISRVLQQRKDQLAIKTGGVKWSYFWLILLLGWFPYLLSEASSYRWITETKYWYIGVTFGAAILIARNFSWIYSWHTSPLGAWLIVTPLYVIKTNPDRLWFWPIWSISDIDATHQYTNGIYQGTSVSISFDGKKQNLTISPQSTYSLLVSTLKRFDEKVRLAIKQDDVDYLVKNDDLLEYRLNKNTDSSSKANSAIKKSIIYYFLSLLVSFSIYGVANSINGNSLDRRSVAYNVNPPEYPQNKSVNPSYTRPNLAPNGESWPRVAGYVKGFKKLHTDGLSKITIDNSQNNSDVFIKLISINGQESYPVRVFFIPASSQFTINKVRAGLYDIRYRDLDSGSLSKSESFTLEEIETDEGIQYSNFTMTLYKIQNGNMQTYGLSENEF